MFGRWRSALKKTTDFLNTDIRDLFKREGRLVDDQFLDELYAILVKTDMGTGPAARIRDRIGSDFRARVVHMTDVLKSVQDEVRAILQQPERPIHFAASGPTVILVVGVNGSGKTTSIAKLMRMFRDQGKKVVVGAGDTFRAAAAEQLTIWAQREGAAIVKGEKQGDPAAVAHKAVALAIETGSEICIIDTAGRLQTQTNLMQQLEKIYRVITQANPRRTARSAAGARCHGRPKRDQPGSGFFDRRQMHGHHPGQARRHGQGGRDPADPREIRHPCKIRRPGREGERFGRVQRRPIRRCAVCRCGVVAHLEQETADFADSADAATSSHCPCESIREVRPDHEDSNHEEHQGPRRQIGTSRLFVHFVVHCHLVSPFVGFE